MGVESDLVQEANDAQMGRSLGDHQGRGNLAIGVAVRQQGHDLPLSPSQVGWQRLWSSPPAAPGTNRRRSDRVGPGWARLLTQGQKARSPVRAPRRQPALASWLPPPPKRPSIGHDRAAAEHARPRGRSRGRPGYSAGQQEMDQPLGRGQPRHRRSGGHAVAGGGPHAKRAKATSDATIPGRSAISTRNNRLSRRWV